MAGVGPLDARSPRVIAARVAAWSRPTPTRARIRTYATAAKKTNPLLNVPRGAVSARGASRPCRARHSALTAASVSSSLCLNARRSSSNRPFQDKFLKNARRARWDAGLKRGLLYTNTEAVLSGACSMLKASRGHLFSIIALNFRKIALLRGRMRLTDRPAGKNSYASTPSAMHSLN